MQSRPLNGLCVLELGGYISGPYATSMLQSLGAEVIKIERPVSGDEFRRGVNSASPYFLQYNAGKKSLAVDVKDSRGLDIVRRLLATSDVLVENMRPGKLAALGLGKSDCLVLNPALVYVSLTGFGEGGPFRDRPAYDTIGQAASGFYSVMGDKDDPQLSGTCIADLVAGLTGTAAVLAGLVGKLRSGTGVSVQTSLMEAVSTLTIDALTQMQELGYPPYRGTRHPQAQNFSLRTSSGGTLAVHLSSSAKFWLGLVRALEQPELATDPRFVTYDDRVDHYDELDAVLRPIFLQRPASEWERRLLEADVPFAAILGMDEVARHPQTEWLQLVEPAADGRPALARVPWRFDGVRPPRAPVAPRVGEDTRELASRFLDSKEIELLIAQGVLSAPAYAAEPGNPQR